MKLNEIKIWKFNILDITIVFVMAICLALFLSNRTSATPTLSSGDEVSSSITKFTYVVGINSVSDTTGSMIKVGDKLYDKVTSTEMGTITNIKIENAKGYFNLSSGEIKLSDVPGKIDIKLTVETEGNVKEGEYYANNLIRILAGGNKQLKTKYVMFTGEVVEFKD